MINFKGFNIVCLDGLGNAPNCYEELINSNMILRNIFFWIPIFFFFFLTLVIFTLHRVGNGEYKLNNNKQKPCFLLPFCPI